MSWSMRRILLLHWWWIFLGSDCVFFGVKCMMVYCISCLLQAMTTTCPVFRLCPAVIILCPLHETKPSKCGMLAQGMYCSILMLLRFLDSRKQEGKVWNLKWLFEKNCYSCNYDVWIHMCFAMNVLFM